MHFDNIFSVTKQKHIIYYINFSNQKKKEPKFVWEKRNYLSAPLASRASLGGDTSTVFPVHQLLQAVDLILIVNVDFKIEVDPISSLGPREITAVGERQEASRRADEIDRRVRDAWTTKCTVQNPGEEERSEDQQEGCYLLRASAQRLMVSFVVVVVHALSHLAPVCFPFPRCYRAHLK